MPDRYKPIRRSNAGIRALILSFLPCVCLLSAPDASALTLNVNPATAGNPASCGTDPSRATVFKTFHHPNDGTGKVGAADCAKSGDLVRIYGGTYYETVTPREDNITFQPYDSTPVKISGSDPVYKILGLASGSNEAWQDDTPAGVTSYKKYSIAVTLPAPSDPMIPQGRYTYQLPPPNTQLFARQVFYDDAMQV